MADDLSCSDAVTLLPNVENAAHKAMPSIALGTYRANGPRLLSAVTHAFSKAGYRHVDTAALYDNEDVVAAGIAAAAAAGGPSKFCRTLLLHFFRSNALHLRSHGPDPHSCRVLCGSLTGGITGRGDVWITTKLWNSDHGAFKTRKAIHNSLKRLNTDYIDLYLIHSPGNSGRSPAQIRELRKASWQVMEKMHEEGTLRAIGVSNYDVKHLEELATYAKYAPAVNQVEFHPYLVQGELLAYCASKGIVVEAYGSMAAGENGADPLLKHPTVLGVAERAGKSAAQVLLRWALQKGLVVLPKSVTPARIDANAALFDFALDGEAMAALDALHTGERTYWDNTDVP